MQPQPHPTSHLLLAPGQPPLEVRVRHCSHHHNPDSTSHKLDLIGPAGLPVPCVVTLQAPCGREAVLHLTCSWPLPNNEALYLATADPPRVAEPLLAA